MLGFAPQPTTTTPSIIQYEIIACLFMGFDIRRSYYSQLCSLQRLACQPCFINNFFTGIKRLIIVQLFEA
jgi:hypothetical protein